MLQPDSNVSCLVIHYLAGNVSVNERIEGDHEMVIGVLVSRKIRKPHESSPIIVVYDLSGNAHVMPASAIKRSVVHPPRQ